MRKVIVVVIGLAIMFLGTSDAVGQMVAQQALPKEATVQQPPPLVGKWEWQYDGVGRTGQSFTIVVTLEVDAISPEGAMTGREKFWLNLQPGEQSQPLKSAQLFRRPDGIWGVIIKQGNKIYDLTVVDDKTLRGPFERPGWQGEAVFRRKQ